MLLEKYNSKNSSRFQKKSKNQHSKKLSTFCMMFLLAASQNSMAQKGIIVSTSKEPVKGQTIDLQPSRNWSAIGTGPYFGLGASYDGSDLVALQPNIHKDLGLLKQQQFIAKMANDPLAPSSPFVQFSGITEVQMVVQDEARNNVDITMANLDIDAWVNPWLTAYTNFGVESDDARGGRFRMIQAFATVGNLNKSPFYGSLGQMYVPFGSFSTGTSDMGSVTRNVGRIYARALSAGYYPGNGWHLTGAVYNGKTKNSEHKNIDQFATTAIHEGDVNIGSFPAKLKVGLSYTNNIAESAIFSDIFNRGAILKRFVPAADGFMQLKVQPWVMRVEYVSALGHFDKRDIQQKGRQIQPRSMLVEIGYDFVVMGKPSWVTLHTSKVNDAAAASPVNNQIGINTSINILKNTLLSFEVSHRRNYSKRDYVSNNDKAPFDPAIAATIPSEPLNAFSVMSANRALDNGNKNVLVTTLDIFY